MTITTTELRKKIFSELDKVITTGQPLEVRRRGHKLKIILDKKKSKLSTLTKKENIITCSDDELIYDNCLKDWRYDVYND